MRGLAFGKQFVICSHQFVSKMNHRITHIFQMGAHNDFVVIPRRSLVAAARVDYRDEASVIAFHVAIGEAQAGA